MNIPIYSLIVPLGIVSGVFLLLTVATGFLHYKYHVKWLKMKWHMWLGFITLALAAAHAVVVFIANS